MSTLALALQITAINGASSILGKVSRDVNGFADKASQKADQMKKHFNDAWLEIGKGAIAMQYGLSKMDGIVKPAADLEEAMLAVRSNLGSNTMAAKDLNDQLKKVAETSDLIATKTRLSKVDAANLQNELFKGGLAQQDIVGDKGAGVATATLATLGGMDAGTAATSVVNIGSMFGLAKEQYAELADNLVRVDDAAATSVPKLVYGLQQAGFSAKALGENSKSTAIALAMLSPLGEMAGTSLNRMLENTTGKTPKARKHMIELGLATMKAGKFDNKFYDHGKFIGIAKALDLIKTKLNAVKGDGARLKIAEQIFGEEGGRAALAAMLTGQSYEVIKKGMESSYSSAQKLEIMMGGMNAQTDRFKNSWSGLSAEIFDPLTKKVTALLASMADGFNNLTKIAKDSPATKNALSIGAGVAGAGLLTYILAKFGGGAKSMFKGLSGTAAGVAEGKALQAAAGVTPVFVVNMPGGGISAGSAAGGLAETALGAGAGSAAGGILGKLFAMAKMPLGALAMTGSASGAATGLGMIGGGVLAAGAAGYGAGTLINKGFIEGTALGDKIGESVAKVLAAFGNKEAQQAVNINLSLDGKQIATVVNAQNSRQASRK